MLAQDLEAKQGKLHLKCYKEKKENNYGCNYLLLPCGSMLQLWWELHMFFLRPYIVSIILNSSILVNNLGNPPSMCSYRIFRVPEEKS